MNPPHTRRAALLGAAALLSGCSSLENLFGERKTPLPGERRSIMRSDAALAADAGLDGRAVELPPAQPITAWPMAGGPSNHAPGHAEMSPQPGQAWRVSAGSGSGYRQRLASGPIIADGTVFAVDAFGMLGAFNLADGARRWRIETERPDESASPLGGGVAHADGVLYVTTALAEVLAVSPADGAVRWRANLPAPARSAPSVAGGRIFVATNENHLLALSTEDGRRLWTYRAQSISTLPFGMPAPAVEGETVVAGFGTGELTGLRAADGRVLWVEGLAGAGASGLADIVGITALPVIDRGRVFASGLGNITVAVDLRSGRRLWERAFGGPNGVASAGDWVFLATRGGDVMAIGREDGRIRWVAELDPSPEAGRRRREPATFGPPLLAGGRVMVPSSRAELVLLDPATGTQLGRVALSSGVTLPGAITDGMLVLLGDDGTLMGLR
jgi:outer membrane protein assembly factor BamB